MQLLDAFPTTTILSPQQQRSGHSSPYSFSSNLSFVVQVSTMACTNVLPGAYFLFPQSTCPPQRRVSSAFPLPHWSRRCSERLKAVFLKNNIAYKMGCLVC